MNPPEWLSSLSTLSLRRIRDVLKEKKLKSSVSSRQVFEAFHQQLNWPYQMSWRIEQQQCLAMFQREEWRELIIQAIFGGGKTTMMLAMIHHLMMNGQDPSTIQICAFNVCIKNEIKKKLRYMSSRFHIQTFDSMIYGICQELGYETMNALDFHEKRKFVQQHLSRVIPKEDMMYLFVDEAQDLEKIAYSIFKKRFPNARHIFVGDVFQSIQKEPRESMLWYLIKRPPHPEYALFSMTDTPRVPPMILGEMRTALLQYYPEFSSTIDQWKSSNPSLGCPISWHGFDSYKQVYDQLLIFLQEKGPENVMVLTFSSAITVRGALGDVSRVRQFLVKQGIPVNSNHKHMKDNAVFLSTANSSKGLERDHVFGFLTFPLEKAFMNFSDDLVVNLTTVALSRCKKSVCMYIPKHQDRYSKVLTLYEKCPSPTTTMTTLVDKTKKKPQQDEMYDVPKDNKRFMLEKEHSITEAIRLQILSYSTRHLLKTYLKKYQTLVIPTQTKGLCSTEEDSTFCGLVFETLTLGMWKGEWPRMSPDFIHHDMFKTFQKSIRMLYDDYTHFIHSHPFSHPASRVQGAVLYAKVHLACFHKIFWTEKKDLIEKIRHHWNAIQGVVAQLRPTNIQDLKVQHNVAMPFLTGIADAILLPSQGFIEIFEIKASKSTDWLENALIQAILYGICLGKTCFRIHLANVFAKEIVSYVVRFQEDFHKVRDHVLSDVYQWNLNCFLAKNISHHDLTKQTLPIENVFFMEIVDKKMCFVEINSPTKTCLHYKGEMTDTFLSQLKQWIQDFQIKRIIGGRSLDSKQVMEWIGSEIDLTLFKFIKGRSTWPQYLESIGWTEYKLESNRSYLDWNDPQCRFMVQWSHLATLYNL